MKKQIAVIGLGRFGESLCIELSSQGVEVLAVDINKKAVNQIAPVVTQAIIADITDEQVIDELNLSNYETVVLSLGTNTGASLLAAISLKEAGVKQLWVKSSSALHTKTLEKIGADRVINPERIVAKSVSRQLISHHVFDFIDLGDEQAIYELKVSKGFDNRTIESLSIPKDVHALCLKRSKELIQNVEKEQVLLLGDILLLAGPTANLNKLIKRMSL